MTITKANDGVTYTHPDKGSRSADVVVSVSAGSIAADGSIIAAASPGADTGNSTTAVLGNAGVYTGTWTQVDRYTTINVSVFTDQASATDGLSIQQSSDGTNADIRDTFTVPITAAGGGKTYRVQVAAKFYRVVYTNNTTPQTAFRLQSVLKTADAANSVRPADAYSNENDVGQSQAFNMLWNGTTWDRWRSTPYQTSQTPLAAGSGNVANASAAATLTGTATTTVYIAGFEVTGAGATAGAVVSVTVAGLLGGSRIFTYTFATGVAVGNAPLVVAFNPPLPASAVNTAISVTCPAGGAGNTNNTVVAHGFYQ